ncbi:uncharacterized protein [Triticum aestivum]|uniref:uncharacterized protein isoform X1 n=1 Tax=Triticum aestivum TaxID=4565 RepID=UPI001D02B96B|nr:uncharacterized protein LOC123078718 isoform X1 [Triticum aestivum]XP_044357243.1 uncharacterized protein LOC123078718 isoform X1 [Triticum aestivum]
MSGAMRAAAPVALVHSACIGDLLKSSFANCIASPAGAPAIWPFPFAVWYSVSAAAAISSGASVVEQRFSSSSSAGGSYPSTKERSITLSSASVCTSRCSISAKRSLFICAEIRYLAKSKYRVEKLAHLRSRGPMGCFLDAVIPLLVVIKKPKSITCRFVCWMYNPINSSGFFLESASFHGEIVTFQPLALYTEEETEICAMRLHIRICTKHQDIIPSTLYGVRTGHTM